MLSGREQAGALAAVDQPDLDAVAAPQHLRDVGLQVRQRLLLRRAGVLGDRDGVTRDAVCGGVGRQARTATTCPPRRAASSAAQWRAVGDLEVALTPTTIV